MLEAIQPTASDHLIFLGDYVDRGPDSRKVIDLLVELKQKISPIFLLGNHEIMFRQALLGAPLELWLNAGGQETVDSYGDLTCVSLAHRKFLEDLLPFYETDTHLFVHANYLPNLPLEQQPEDFLYWRHLTENIPDPHISGKHAICGHTPQPGGHVGYYGHLTCLDTGCFLGLCLSAMELETGRVWQSDRQGRVREPQMPANGWNVKDIARKG